MAESATSGYICAVILFLVSFGQVLETFASPDYNEEELQKENEEVQFNSCYCYNITESYELIPECRCAGKIGRELRIDKHYSQFLPRITITDSTIDYIHRDFFLPFKDSLEDLVLGNLPSLRVIDRGAFRNMPNLRTIYISEAPQLKFLPGVFDGITSKKFKSLRIVKTGLLEIPDLSHLQIEDNILHMIDLEGNDIEVVKRNSIKIKAELVTLSHNHITLIEDYAFNGSQIGRLNLAGNRNLVEIQKAAFGGLESLQELDLSETSISSLPIIGLADIEVLKVTNTPTMKIIPSIYDLPNLKEAFLTHPFHCCAFEYPEQHDPDRHAIYEQKLKKQCQEAEKMQTVDTGQWGQILARKKRSDLWEEPFDMSYIGENFREGTIGEEPWGNREVAKMMQNESDRDPIRGEIIERHEGKPQHNHNVLGVFHQNTAEISDNKQVNYICGNISIRKRQVKCYPEPNALNPCEDIMGSTYLRVSVWFVVVLAVLGNLAVVIVVLFSGGELTVSRFLISNLAFADFCMGIYLLLIASMDLHSMGTYFNFAFDWQFGLGCKVAGFLTVFSSLLSIFTLTLVTVERWFAITYAVYLTRRLNLRTASKIMVGGWMYSIIMAAIPLFGVSNYSSTSICLPMEVNQEADKAYLLTLIIINGLAFGLIVFCYAQIYFSLAYETRRASTKGEMTIAKKMALLVFTDFACWAPIAFFALTALAGYPLIGVTRSKILLVFFYPLNSCANPYLYAIMTAQYRRDFFILLGRFGICKERAKQYTLSTSLPTNNSHPMPLLGRINGKERKNSKNNVNDVFV